MNTLPRTVRCTAHSLVADLPLKNSAPFFVTGKGPGAKSGTGAAPSNFSSIRWSSAGARTTPLQLTPARACIPLRVRGRHLPEEELGRQLRERGRDGRHRGHSKCFSGDRPSGKGKAAITDQGHAFLQRFSFPLWLSCTPQPQLRLSP